MTAPRASQSNSTPRKAVFRTVRLVLALSLLSGLGYLGWRAVTVVAADQAYINAEIISVRAPIGGELHTTALEPGTPVTAGAPLLRVENPRFADTHIASELGRMQEMIERLRVECEEAEARLPKLEEIFKHATAMRGEKLMSPVQFMEEEAKLAVTRVTVSRKREQLQLAEQRCAALEEQVAAIRESSVAAPFDGAVWAASQHEGALVQQNESVVQLINAKRLWVDAFLPERHAAKFQVGMSVKVRLVDGGQVLEGCVESIRAGVGRVPFGNTAVAAFGEFTQRRIAVRVQIKSENPFTASEFYGVGRSVTLEI
jgi:multidrug resistance efflux pump